MKQFCVAILFALLPVCTADVMAQNDASLTPAMTDTVEIRTVTDFRRLADRDFDTAVSLFWSNIVSDRRIRTYCADYLLNVLAGRHDAVAYYKFLEKLVAAMPDNIEYLKRIGDIALRIDRFDDAYHAYLAIYRRVPQDYTANSFLGNYYFDEGMRRLADVDKNYKPGPKHTRAEMEFYLDKKRKVIEDFFYKAYRHFKVMSDEMPSDLVRRRMGEIEQMLDENDMRGVR